MDNPNSASRARSRSTGPQPWVDNVQKRFSRDGSVTWHRDGPGPPFQPAVEDVLERKGRPSLGAGRDPQARAERDGKAELRADLTSLTIAQLVKLYLDDRETRRLSSYNDYCARLAWWVNELGYKRVRDLGVVSLREAREKLSRSGITPATVNRYLSALRSAWNWGRSTEYLSTTQVWPPKLLLTEAKARTRNLSDDELWIASCRSPKSTARRCTPRSWFRSRVVFARASCSA